MENKNNEITKDILLTGELIVSAIKAQLNNEEYAFDDNTNFEKLHKLAEKHKVTPMVAPSVLACENAPEEYETYKLGYFDVYGDDEEALYRYQAYSRTTDAMTKFVARFKMVFMMIKNMF